MVRPTPHTWMIGSVRVGSCQHELQATLLDAELEVDVVQPVEQAAEHCVGHDADDHRAAEAGDHHRERCESGQDGRDGQVGDHQLGDHLLVLDQRVADLGVDLLPVLGPGLCQHRGSEAHQQHRDTDPERRVDDTHGLRQREQRHATDEGWNASNVEVLHEVRHA